MIIEIEINKLNHATIKSSSSTRRLVRYNVRDARVGKGTPTLVSCLRCSYFVLFRVRGSNYTSTRVSVYCARQQGKSNNSRPAVSSYYLRS